MHKAARDSSLNVENENQSKEFKNIQKNAGKNVPVLVQEMPAAA